jgi:hypothetical protein
MINYGVRCCGFEGDNEVSELPAAYIFRMKAADKSKYFL